MHIIVFHKDDTAAETFLSRKMNNRLYELLALIVLRVSLTGDDYLYRVFWVVDDALQPVRVIEKECSPLVCGETPSKANSKGIWCQDFAGGLDIGR